jgi:hypothetical protein
MGNLLCSLPGAHACVGGITEAGCRPCRIGVYRKPPTRSSAVCTRLPVSIMAATVRMSP